MRVAVTGVPHGGTSIVVGLARILGLELPLGTQDCVIGETAEYRSIQNPTRPRTDQLAERIDSLPEGVVWKDPTVATYAKHIQWDNWTVIEVRRDPLDVALSEKRWKSHPGSVKELEKRARQWYWVLDKKVKKPALTLHLDDIRKDGFDALQTLADVLDVDEPTGNERYLVEQYLSSGKYRCPLPTTCAASH